MGTPGGQNVDPLGLRDYADYLGELALDVQTIRLSAMYEGMNSSGFTGLLTPGGQACEAVRSSLLQPMFEMLQQKLFATGEGVRATAEAYGLTEAENTERVERPLGGGAHAV